MPSTPSSGTGTPRWEPRGHQATGPDSGLTSRTRRPDMASSTTTLLDDKDTSRWLRGAGLKQTATAESRPLLAGSRALMSTRSSWETAATSHQPWPLGRADAPRARAQEAGSLGQAPHPPWLARPGHTLSSVPMSEGAGPRSSLK